ncbi:MAG: hypothetical protein IT534_06310 [Bauldia sp.]|nr:hypothetical protein [Bauldia sp.]
MLSNRKQILDMLGEGKVTSDEADRLLAALGTNAETNGGTSGTNGKIWPKYLRVLVEAEEDEGGVGDAALTKVNIRVPLQLLRAGVRLASLIPRDASDHVNVALRAQGVVFDINQLRPENLEELIDQLRDLTIDVDHSKNKVKVRVFCE